MDHNENNFDFLRLFAALLVLISHQHVLMGRTDISTGPLVRFFSLGGLGVCIFFVISGYLVTQSWLRDPNVLRFAAKRILRIWPGLFVVTCIAALIVGPTTSILNMRDYFSAPEFREYFHTLCLDSVRFYLPGVFPNNPYPNAVNGSLWTIPVEVYWYLILAIAGVMGVLRWRWMALLGVIGFSVYHFGIYHGETNPIRNWSREYGLFFCSGALLQLFHDWWNQRRAFSVISAFIVGMGLFWSGWHVLGVLIAMPFFVISVGQAATPVLRKFGRFGDLSYGVYIYAFMVQQTLIWRFGVSWSFSLHLLTTVVVTFTCAWLSWHFVERPALTLKPLRRRPASVVA